MILIKGIVDEDFINYKAPSMVLLMPYCNWKCGLEECQNSSMATAKEIGISTKKIIERYLNNDITEALVFSGLEPFMSFNDMKKVITELRKCSDDMVVIYTGHNKEEILNEIEELKQFKNIIIKFGRYIPRQLSRRDETLGVILASDNQYAEQIS